MEPFQITDPEEAENSVISAIQAGYRHIDTAQSYMNEEAVGRGIKIQEFLEKTSSTTKFGSKTRLIMAYSLLLKSH